MMADSIQCSLFKFCLHVGILILVLSDITARVKVKLSSRSQVAVSGLELQTNLREDYAKFYNHGKAPTRAFSWLKAPTSAFTFKTLLSIKTLCYASINPQ